jgi:hypothetical protein
MPHAGGTLRCPQRGLETYEKAPDPNVSAVGSNAVNYLVTAVWTCVAENDFDPNQFQGRRRKGSGAAGFQPDCGAARVRQARVAGGSGLHAHSLALSWTAINAAVAVASFGGVFVLPSSQRPSPIVGGIAAAFPAASQWFLHWSASRGMPIRRLGSKRRSSGRGRIRTGDAVHLI